jgi:hypothetical protein
VDVGLINAVTPLMGNGITGTGSLRVTIASDNTSNSNNWNDNIAQINGVAPLMGAGNGGTGSLRVNIASDQVDVGVKQATAANLNAQVVGVAAYGAAASGNVLRAGAKAYDALLTAETAGDQMDLIADKQGRLITAGLAPPDLVNFQATTITASVSETTVVTAGAAGVFNDILGFIVTNSAAAGSYVTIKDSTGGTTRMKFWVPAFGGVVFNPNTPMRQATAANNWTCTCGTSTTSIDWSIMYTTRK